MMSQRALLFSQAGVYLLLNARTSQQKHDREAKTRRRRKQRAKSAVLIVRSCCTGVWVRRED